MKSTRLLVTCCLLYAIAVSAKGSHLVRRDADDNGGDSDDTDPVKNVAPDHSVANGRGNALGDAWIAAEEVKNEQVDLPGSGHDDEKEEELLKEEISATGENINGNGGDTKRRRKRSLIKDTNQLWTKCVIPYEIDDAYYADAQSLEKLDSLMEAFAYYHKWTGFRFIPHNETAGLGLGHSGFAKYILGGSCYSSVGNLNRATGQTISACGGKTAVHENGHLLGLLHENQHPDSMNQTKVYFDEIIQSHAYNYYRIPMSSLNELDGTTFYEVTSVMHYGTWYFNTNYQDTLMLFDHDDNFYLEARYDDFYMFRDLQIFHDCYSNPNFTDCDIERNCEMGGYVTIYNGECKCRCPTGLDMDTNCSSEYVPQPTVWPTGQYSLFKTIHDDCPAGFEDGTIVHWPKLTIGKGYSNMAPGYNSKYVEHDTCTKTNGATGTGHWPPGEYCILRKGGSCTAGLTQGMLQTYGEDVYSNYPNVNSGVEPDGNHGRLFEYEFCCNTDGSNMQELEIDIFEHFILFPTTSSCQTIRNTYVIREWFTWRNLDIPVNITGTVPYMYFGSSNLVKVYMCVYFPVTTGTCGEIKTFSASETSYTFTTPGHPAAYPQQTECYWRFESPENTIMQLNFNAFNVPAGSNDICGSEVELRDWYPGMNGYRFCSSDYKKTHWSKLNFLTVKFFSDLTHSGTGFNATITVLPLGDHGCFQGDGSEGVYAGDINFGKNFGSCVRWEEATDCSYHAFEQRTVDDDLTGHNYCRNVGIGELPWCYRHADNCERQVCDACQLGNCYDMSNECSTLISNDANFCSDNENGEAHRICRQSCNECPTVATGLTCSAPGSVQSVSAVPVRSSYDVGDVVSYTCSATGHARTRTCTSEGTWTSLLAVCHVCPTGWAVFQKQCYKLLDYQILLTHADAKVRCASLGGHLPKITSQEENDFLANMIEYEGTDQGTYWIGTEKTNDVWKWTYDESNLTYTNWRPNHPRPAHSCAKAQNGLWRSSYCGTTDAYYVICEINLPDLDDVSSCIDVRADCATTLAGRGDMCTTYPDYAWHNCRVTCGVDVCKDSAVSCTDDATLESTGSGTRTVGGATIDHGEYVEYECNTGYFHTSGDLKRACLPDGTLTGVTPVCSSAATTSSFEVNADVVLKRRSKVNSKKRIVVANNSNSIAPVAGTIQSWSFYSNFPGTVAFVVLRPPASPLTSLSAQVFTVIGKTVIDSVEDRIMTYDIPTGEEIAIQAGDFIGIYHRANEVSYTRCKEAVEPENSMWMQSSVQFSSGANLPANSATVTFSELGSSYNCRLYSLHYTLDPT